MHEMSLAVGVVQEVERCLDGFGPRSRVTAVTLQVGRMRAVVPEAMTFCFQAAAGNSRAEGAELRIEELPVTGRCMDCRREVTLEEIDFRCGECGGILTLETGKELILRSIEVEDPDASENPQTPEPCPEETTKGRDHA